MYSPSSLDLERSSWRTVVYINLVRSIRNILESLEFDFDLDYDPAAGYRVPDSISPPVAGPSSPKTIASNPEEEHELDIAISQASPLKHRNNNAAQQELATLRLRLLPLLSVGETLAKSFGRGIQVAPGKEEVFVRFGWQGIRPKGNQKLGSAKGKSPYEDSQKSSSIAALSSASPTTSISTSVREIHQQQTEREEIIRPVVQLLAASLEDVIALWSHPAVKSIIRKRRLRLEDSSTL